MKKFSRLLIICLLFIGCESEAETTYYKQIEAIIDYLENNELEYVENNNVYKVKRDYQLASYTVSGDTTALAIGDSVYINYMLSIFTTSPKGVYDTNILSLAEYLEMDTAGKEFVPYGIKYGTSMIIRGLEIGLNGLRAGDNVSLYMPFTLAYGEKELGLLPGSSAINLDIDVIRVKKN